MQMMCRVLSRWYFLHLSWAHPWLLHESSLTETCYKCFVCTYWLYLHLPCSSVGWRLQWSDSQTKNPGRDWNYNPLKSFEEVTLKPVICAHLYFHKLIINNKIMIYYWYCYETWNTLAVQVSEVFSSSADKQNVVFAVSDSLGSQTLKIENV